MKSILSLQPALQAVWAAVYAATVQGEHSVLANPETVTMASDEVIGTRAESAAWEAVRRANGGEMPGDPSKTDDKTWKRSAMRDALLWFADEGNLDGDPRGVSKAREALGLPIDRHVGGLMPLAEALTHGAAIGADVDEPTEEDMVEALAPIVAACQYLPGVFGEMSDETRADDLARAMRALRHPVTGDDADADDAAAIHIVAAWKAARAWGRK